MIHRPFRKGKIMMMDNLLLALMENLKASVMENNELRKILNEQKLEIDRLHDLLALQNRTYSQR